jgi:hypothetical protein
MTGVIGKDDLRLKDWEECRTTIGRLDSILVDLRKVGFSIITGLLTAGGFLGFLGIGAKDASTTPELSGAVFIAIMVLVAALYSVDSNFQVLLIGAVQRAREIEATTAGQIRVTEYLYLNATRSKVSYVTPALYMVLLLTAEAFGLFATKAVHAPTFMPSLLWIALIGAAVSYAALIFLQFAAWPHTLAAIGVVALWATLSLAVVLATTVYGPFWSVAYWLIGTGTLLALFVQLYWNYVEKQVGLKRSSTEPAISAE